MYDDDDSDLCSMPHITFALHLRVQLSAFQKKEKNAVEDALKIQNDEMTKYLVFFLDFIFHFFFLLLFHCSLFTVTLIISITEIVLIMVCFLCFSPPIGHNQLPYNSVWVQFLVFYWINVLHWMFYMIYLKNISLKTILNFAKFVVHSNNMKTIIFTIIFLLVSESLNWNR